MPKPSPFSRPTVSPRFPTTAALNYLTILFADLRFDRQQRNAFLSRELGREVSYLDELSAGEVSRFIDALKERKQARKSSLEDLIAEEDNFDKD